MLMKFRLLFGVVNKMVTALQWSVNDVAHAERKII